jgi:eukaryotic-like serine/threonine-protein kinase
MTQNRPDLIEPHEVIGQRYLIVRPLREEPWGGVWLAQDNLLRIEIGLKLLPRDDAEWAATRDMFESEAILGLKLRHPQILGVFYVGKAEKFLYLVEEPFPGGSLMTQLNQQKRSGMTEALDLLERLGETLAFAHQRGVVHQSLNPRNILLADDDMRVANFACAPAYDDQPLHLELKAYAPPEVINGERLTPAGNVFSLGVLGFRLVAGSLPYPLTFDEPFPYRLEYPPADLEEIPVPLQNLLLRCLSEDPEERLPQAGDFVSQLRQARELMYGVSKEPYASARPLRSRVNKISFAQAGPFLKRVWEEHKPDTQKAREAALTRWQTLKESPWRPWWGAALAAVVIALIIGGFALSKLSAPKPQPMKMAAQTTPKVTAEAKSTVTPEAPPKTAPPTAPAVSPPAVGGGPPLQESGEAIAHRKPAPVARMTHGRAVAPASALASPAAAKEGRYLLLVATFTQHRQAQALQRRLRASHLHAIIIHQRSGRRRLYQVRVGPVTGAKAAEDAANRIKSEVKITAKIVKLAPRHHGAAHVRRPSR